MLWTLVLGALAHPLPTGGEAQPGREAPPARPEAAVLAHPVQLTSREQFVKAGEAYFNPDESWIIFQAVPVPESGEPDPFYSMYVGRLVREEGHVTGMTDVQRISAPGSANTCGWFHPEIPGRVLFGSTMEPPRDQDRSGFQVGSRKYVWQFPPETEIVTRFIPEIFMSTPGETKFDRTTFVLPDDTTVAKRMFERPEYDAEASWSADGRYVLYAHVNERESLEPADADIWVYDTRNDSHMAIVQARGYDGGPFFSPDGRWVCYRSDRRNDNLLQLFMTELEIDESGAILGAKREIQLTENEHVNWAPFWHPSGEFMVYASSEVGHWNYEVFAIDADPDVPIESRRRVRVTTTPGADVLPVISPSGTMMMWTAQRGPLGEGDQRPSSQIWIAELTGDLLGD